MENDETKTGIHVHIHKTKEQGNEAIVNIILRLRKDVGCTLRLCIILILL